MKQIQTLIVYLFLCCMTTLFAKENKTMSLLQAGDKLPPAALPKEWLRGEPIDEFQKGISYVVTFWSSRKYRNFKPGYNIEQSINRTASKYVRGVVLCLQDGTAKEKLLRKLTWPSQQSPYPIAYVTDPNSAIVTKWYSRMSKEKVQRNTMVIRDGVIVWLGEGTDLRDSTLKYFATKEFDYATYLQEKAEIDRKAKALGKRIYTDYNAAIKAGDEQLAKEILQEVAQSDYMPSWLHTRICDIRIVRAHKKNDKKEALVQIAKMADAFPKKIGTQSWAHKHIVTNEKILEDGRALASRICLRIGKELSEGKQSIAWLQMAATHFEKIGEFEKAIDALKEAEQKTTHMQKLKKYKAALNGK